MGADWTPEEGRKLQGWREREGAGECRQARSRCGTYLTYSYIGILLVPMARAATTLDPFNAVAELRRREILEYLAGQEHAVGEIVDRLQLPQPSVSKHLGVLRKVGLVRSRRHGREVLYRINADGIRPLYEWTKSFEQLWQHQLLRVKERAEAAHKLAQEKPSKEKE